MACPTIGERKGSSLPSVYFYQIKNYRFQNLESVKSLNLEKKRKFQNNIFFKKRINKTFYSKLKKTWRSEAMVLSKSIDSLQLIYKNFIIHLVQKPQIEKKRKFTMKELFLCKNIAFFAMIVRRRALVPVGCWIIKIPIFISVHG